MSAQGEPDGVGSNGSTSGNATPDGTGPGGAPDSGDGERDGRPRHRSGQVRAAAITAAATVVAAVIAAGVALLTNTDSGTGPEAKQPGSSSTPTTEPTTDASDDASKPARGPVLRSGEGIEMVSDTSLDLDSDTPNWDAGTFTHRGTDLYLNSNRFIGGLEAPRLIVTTGKERSPDTCKVQTALKGTIKYDDLRSGLTACVVTTERRWAWVEVRKYSPDPLKLVVDVVVWTAVAATPDDS